MERSADAFWREVNVIVRSKGCGGDPKDFLLGYPGEEEVWDLVEILDHDIWMTRDAWFEVGFMYLDLTGSTEDASDIYRL